MLDFWHYPYSMQLGYLPDVDAGCLKVKEASISSSSFSRCRANGILCPAYSLMRVYSG
jgi:hypothetical protein